MDERWTDISRERKNDSRFYYWEISEIRQKQLRSVPIRIEKKEIREGKPKSWHPIYTDQGLKNFWPWFVLDKNTSKNDDYFEVVVEILKRIEPKNQGTKKKYSYIRGDVNIFMPWLRVSAYFDILMKKFIDDLFQACYF